MATFNAVLKFLNPGESGENLIHYGGSSTQLDTNVHHKRGRPCSLSPRDQFFLFMCRVRLGLFQRDIAHRFSISEATVSRIVVTWANFIYLRLGSIPIWPTKDQVVASMPKSFKLKYPATRVIIDCTEIKCEIPSYLVLQSKSYSNYKSSW